jgi:hypothetical protein
MLWPLIVDILAGSSGVTINCDYAGEPAHLGHKDLVLVVVK